MEITTLFQPSKPAITVKPGKYHYRWTLKICSYHHVGRM